MIIAKRLKKENIAEYILYMWQLEDVLRSVSFDMNILEERIISSYEVSDSQKNEIREWYKTFVDGMIAEKVTEQGHLLHLSSLIQDLSDLNIKLLQQPNEMKYNELFNEAIPNISEIVNRSGGQIKNEIEACFVGLYGMMLMKMKKQQISESTQVAMKSFSNLLALLSNKYHKFEEGELVFD